MTPTPEMIAEAERIEAVVAAKVYAGEDAGYHPYFDAALTAIMEVSEKAAVCAAVARHGLSAWRCRENIAAAIRNGEHLR